MLGGIVRFSILILLGWLTAGIVLAGSARADELPTEATADASPVLTLEAAVRLALQRNPVLAQSRGVYRQAVGRHREAQALRNPTASASGRFTAQGPIPVFQIRNPTTGATQSIRFGKDFTKDADVSATYDTDLSGRLRAAVRSARHDASLARTGITVDTNDLVLVTQQAFLAALRARELTGVAKEAVDAAKEQLRVAQAYFDAGEAPEFDVLRARVQVANLRQEVVAARAQTDRALTMLARILSVDPEELPALAPITLPADAAEPSERAALQALSLGGDQSLPPVPQSTGRAVDEALAHRPEVVRSEWRLRLARARINAAKRGNRPNASLTASYFYTPDQSGFSPVKNSWSFIASLSMPLWDGGVTRTRVHQSREALRTAVAEQQAVHDGVQEEVRTALISLREARERRGAAAATTGEAREALRIARVRYDAGVAPGVEVTDAEVALTRARTNEVNAGYDYLDALAALNRALGRYTHYDRLAAAGRP